MTELCYINTEPHDVTASLRLDDAAVTIIPGIGSQHVEFSVPTTELGRGASLTVAADGYATLDGARVLLTTPQLTWPDGSPCDVVLESAQTTLPRLVADGRWFAREGVGRCLPVMWSEFNWFARLMDGEDVEPVLQQRLSALSLAPNEPVLLPLARMWTLYDVAGIGRLIPAERPTFYNDLALALQVAARNGVYAEVTAFTGTSRLLPRPSQQQDHLDAVADVVRRSSNAICEVGNEWDQGDNRWFLNLQWPTGILVSGGSVGSRGWPEAVGLPRLGYSEYHTNLAPDWERETGHAAMEISDTTGRPTLTNENQRFPDRDNSLAHVEDAAAGAVLLSGQSGCFHTPHGKTSEFWDDQEVSGAQAHARGVRSISVNCLDGAYRHGSHEIEEEERGGYDRVYQRGDDPMCRVRIRP